MWTRLGGPSCVGARFAWFSATAAAAMLALQEVAVSSARLAKLSAPRTTNWLARARLHRLLDEAAKQAVVWIAAGPGAGKSTLAACWAATRGPRTLWYRVDEGDAD